MADTKQKILTLGDVLKAKRAKDAKAKTDKEAKDAKAKDTAKK